MGRKMDAELVQQRDHVARPTDGDRGGANGVFENQVPSDDPGQPLAHGGVGVGVRAARYRNHAGELAVAQACEGAAYRRHHHGERDRGAGVLRGGEPGEREQPGTDDGANPQGDQVARAERPPQVLCLGLGMEIRQRLLLKQCRR